MLHTDYETAMRFIRQGDYEAAARIAGWREAPGGTGCIKLDAEETGAGDTVAANWREACEIDGLAHP